MGRATIKTTTLVFEMRVQQPPSMTASQLEAAAGQAILNVLSTEFPQHRLLQENSGVLVELKLIKKETEYK